MRKPYELTPVSEEAPPVNQVIIVENFEGKKDQVEIRNGAAYEWRYKSTDNEFCKVSEISKWRGCGGFDF